MICSWASDVQLKSSLPFEKRRTKKLIQVHLFKQWVRAELGMARTWTVSISAASNSDICKNRALQPRAATPLSHQVVKETSGSVFRRFPYEATFVLEDYT